MLVIHKEILYSLNKVNFGLIFAHSQKYSMVTNAFLCLVAVCDWIKLKQSSYRPEVAQRFPGS